MVWTTNAFYIKILFAPHFGYEKEQMLIQKFDYFMKNNTSCFYKYK